MIRFNHLYKRIYDAIKRRIYYITGKRIIRNNGHASPDFMIIGAAKAGTTSLFQYLSQHPDILPSKNKEPKFFAMGNQKKGLNEYLKNFPLKNEAEGKLTFEATPTYLYLERAPKQISHFFKDQKYIVILRDPVERAYSHWNFFHTSPYAEKVNLVDNRSFEEAVHDELNPDVKVHKYKKYIKKGMYAEQLQNWFSYIDRDRFLILDTHDLKTNPKLVLNDITEYLCLPPFFDDFKMSNKTEGEKWKAESVEDKKILKTYNVNTYHNSLKPETEKKLREIFAQPDANLKQLTGRNFSWFAKN